MKFYVIRHPTTESNIKRITQGWADSPLIPESIKLAEEHGKNLKNKKIKKIYTSDLGRCVQTSNIINQFLKVEIIKKEELREQNLGIYNGIHKDIIKKEFDEHDYEAKPPEGESFKEMKTRVLNFIKKLEKENKEKTILIITHTGCLEGILQKALEKPLNSNKIKTKQETVYLFELENNKIKLIEEKDTKITSS